MVLLVLFNVRTAHLMASPHIPSPIGPDPARGDSGDCMYVHVCLVWPVFPLAFIVPHHLPVCRLLRTDSPAQLDSGHGVVHTWDRTVQPHRGSKSGRQISSQVLYWFTVHSKTMNTVEHLDCYDKKKTVLIWYAFVHMYHIYIFLFGKISVNGSCQIPYLWVNRIFEVKMKLFVSLILVYLISGKHLPFHTSIVLVWQSLTNIIKKCHVCSKEHQVQSYSKNYSLLIDFLTIFRNIHWRI